MVINAEQALLHCILKDSRLIRELRVDEGQFQELRHQRIFRAMKILEQHGEPIDLVSLSTQLREEMHIIGGYVYLNDLLRIVAEPEHIHTYERYIIEEYNKKRIRELAKKINETQDYEQIKEMAQEIAAISVDEQQGDFSLVDVLADIEEEVNTERDGVSGISSGFTDLDVLIDGWNEGEMTIIGARPSMGKTAFALALSANALRAGHFVTMFSLEMSAKSLLKRMICGQAGIHATKMKNPIKWFNEQDWERYRYAQGIISQFQGRFDIDDRSNVTAQDIWARVKANTRKYPTYRHLVIIDYLTLVQGSGRRERHLEVGEISRTLKRMARELDVSVIALAQLNRGVEQRQDKRPVLSDLRDSGEIEQDADKVLFLHRDDYYDRESQQSTIDVIIAKHRNGPLDVVTLYFDRATQTFANLSRGEGE
ncbi:replicative DNA helicase [Geobacillus stearothermophilus]|uniref:replicative DNA helicase n=1 Tax=Geobacillus stearothermophilus TaxID=1422 RepID=UPI002E1A91E1|nr:replicative DNA helicase [Geobacillus stearothermophilus]